ncbi:MAG: dihydroneopterin aldolase [Fimbriimonadaceae bacterium]|nr:dihydroneopterin aldolase [Chthonomonadaceae bacterium]MCO5295228.1 dihydroneopterin aldolase [Fimbriimonadaceae bacterium]
MITLFVEGLEFYAHHGVPEAEQAIGHRYAVDLEIDVREKATQTDRVEDTVDYAAVAEALVGHAQEHRYRTLERLAAGLCDTLFETFEAIVEVRMRLAKRLPPAPIIAEVAGVEIVRSRG